MDEFEKRLDEAKNDPEKLADLSDTTTFDDPHHVLLLNALLKAAKKGDTKCANQYVIQASNAKDKGREKECLEMARLNADLNVNEAFSVLGELYLFGYGMKPDAQRARSIFFEGLKLQDDNLCRFDMALADCAIFDLKKEGSQNDKNILEAQDLLLDFLKENKSEYLAAEALSILANINHSTLGMPKNDITAVKYAKEAIGYDKSNDTATAILAECMLEKSSKKTDYEAVIALIQPLADLSHPRCYFEMGLAYATGRGMPKDFVKAAQIFDEIQDNECNKSKPTTPLIPVFLNLLYSKRHVGEENFKPRQIFTDYKDLYEATKSRSAAYQLFLCYSQGFGTKKNNAKAEEYLQISYKPSPLEAHCCTGLMYLDFTQVDEQPAAKKTRQKSKLFTY
jgi:TPR repeat protein